MELRRRRCDLPRRVVEGSGGKPGPQHNSPPEAVSQPGKETGHARGLFLGAEVRRRRPRRPVEAEQAFGRRRTLHHEAVPCTQLLQERCPGHRVYMNPRLTWTEVHYMF